MMLCLFKAENVAPQTLKDTCLGLNKDLMARATNILITLNHRLWCQLVFKFWLSYLLLGKLLDPFPCL